MVRLTTMVCAKFVTRTLQDGNLGKLEVNRTICRISVENYFRILASLAQNAVGDKEADKEHLVVNPTIFRHFCIVDL